MRHSMDVMPSDFPFESWTPTLRSSGMKTLAKCKRKFLFEQRYGLRRGYYNEALHIGTCFHFCMQKRLSGFSSDQTWAALEQKISDACDELARLFKEGKFHSPESVLGIGESMKQDMSVAFAMHEAYCSAYPLDLDRFQVIGTEVYFCIRVPGIVQLLEGEIDLLLYDRQEKHVVLVDYKTTGWDVEARTATNTFDIQTHLFYATAVRTLLGQQEGAEVIEAGAWDAIPEEGKTLGKVIHGIIKKPTIKLCKKDDFKVSNYVQRVKAWYNDQTDPPLAQSWVPLSGDPLQNGERLRQLQAYDFQAVTSETDPLEYWPRTADDSQCMAYNRPCPFLALCRADPCTWAETAEQLYHQSFRSRLAPTLEEQL